MNSIMQILKKFRDVRDWERYHSIKNLSMALVKEATELMEIFQWEIPEEINEYSKNDLNDEIADCFIYLLNICERLEIDENNIKKIIYLKIEKNEIKYPIKK